MRRVLPVLAATAGGVALLANFRTTPEASGLHTGDAAAALPPSTSSTSAPQNAPSTSVDPSTTVTVQTTAPPTTRPVHHTTVPPTTAAPAPRTVTGPDVLTRYGDVQVQVVLRGGRIEDVRALQLPNERQRSAEISQYAGPRLREEALQAQSAAIDVVSGASYTSEGYRQSLQGALDAG